MTARDTLAVSQKAAGSDCEHALISLLRADAHDRQEGVGSVNRGGYFDWRPSARELSLEAVKP